MAEDAASLVARAAGFAKVPNSYHIRISPTAFLASTATFLAVALISATLRTALRWHAYRKLAVDDYVLMFACACLISVAGVAYTIKDLVYLQIYIGLEWEKPADDFFSQMLIFEKRIVVCSALVWAAIYSVKFAFLLFFWRLVHRVRHLEIQWWVVSGFVLAGGLVSVPLALIICPSYGDDYLTHCPIASQIAHEVIYLQTSVAIDVFTDALLISIPVRMLWGLQMALRRKLLLGGMLCLSLFMIAIAIIRTTLAPLPNGVIDTSWLVFWQGMEAVVAVLMVSLTAFPGLFAAEQSRSSGARKRYQGNTPPPGAAAATPPPASNGRGGSSRPSRRNKGLYNEDSVLLTNVTLPSSSNTDPTVLDEEAGLHKVETTVEERELHP